MKLLGKAIIEGKIEATTGLHVGGSPTGLEIGGVDNPVIKDPKGIPYIPGSSLRGKMRSLLEKSEGKIPNAHIGRGVKIHQCEDEQGYSGCPVCKIFGLPGEKPFSQPTRLLVRDSFLNKNTITEDMKKNLDLEWTEVKFENAIDRITSAANPRQTERVPAGAEFEFEMVYNVFDENDKENLGKVFKAMELLEHDYLGGQGSRGYGKVEFKYIKVFWNSSKDYEAGDIDTEKKSPINNGFDTVAKIMGNFDTVKGALK